MTPAARAATMGRGLQVGDRLGQCHPRQQDAPLQVIDLRLAGRHVRPAAWCVLPGHESEVDEFQCDRQLARAGGAWRVEPI